jgi:hypothetical protein
MTQAAYGSPAYTSSPTADPAEPPAAPAAQAEPATTAHLSAGQLVSHEYTDDYTGEQVTLYGIVVDTVKVDPENPDSEQAIQVAWLHRGLAQLPAGDLKPVG